MASFQYTKDEYVSACIGMAKKRFVRLGALLFIVFSCIAISNASSSTSLLADVLLYFAGFIIALLLIFHLSRRRLRKVLMTKHHSRSGSRPQLATMKFTTPMRRDLTTCRGTGLGNGQRTSASFTYMRAICLRE